MSQTDLFDTSFLTRFLRQESAGGILLVGAAVLAILCANSPLASWYELLIDLPVSVKVGTLGLDKPLLLWVNDGMMAVFFLLVGLELKREFLEGELSSARQTMLPLLGAAGGMAIPSGIYIYCNFHDASALKGWAIPAATDIAFALGVLSLLGNRVPASLKVFLTSLAIFDDIGAIVIIAVFYSSKISMIALAIMAACIPVLYLLHRKGVNEHSPYLAIGLIMWVAMVKSGVHATLAGVILAVFIPLRSTEPGGASPLKTLESDLHSAVAYFILPFFAFCNAGIDLGGVGPEALLDPVPVGIGLGLFFGKQIGVFLFCWLGIRLRVADLPDDLSWLSLYGVSVLCGIGFTMSLFIGSLAFEETGVNRVVDERLGIMLGSLASGVLGFLVLHVSLPTEQPASARPHTSDDHSTTEGTT